MTAKQYVGPASNVAGKSAHSPERNTLYAPLLLYGGVYNPSSAYGHSPSDVRISVIDSCKPERKRGAAHRCRCARLHFLVRSEKIHRPLVTHRCCFAFRSGMRENVPVA